MKIPDIFTPNRKLSGRLTLWVMLTTLVVFGITTYFTYNVVENAVLESSKEYAMSRMEIANQRINSVLVGVETAVENTIPEVEFLTTKPDLLYDVCRQILERNPTIIGSAIAFEPNYFPSKGEQFSPFAYKGIDSIYTKQLGTAEYEYHYMDWYQIPKLLNKSYWSEPYYDQGGAEMMMATYSRPLYDKDGKMYAIMTADVSLEWLTDMMRQNDFDFNMRLMIDNAEDTVKMDSILQSDDFFSTHAYSFIIGRGGTYITHPDHSRILNDTYFTYSLETSDTIDDNIGYDMLAGKSGINTMNRDNTNYTIIYKPIERTGWSMATVVPSHILYARSKIIGAIIIFFMLVGMLILFFVCRRVMKRLTKPLDRFAKSADAIAKGELDTPLPVINTKDEMMHLRTSFELMQKSLIVQIEETKSINEQRGRIEGELQVAREIQMAMLPKTFPAYPDRTEIDIYGQLTPAKEVGGDLYDFLLRDEKLYFCIGDVSGKGVPASLLMAVTRSLFRNIATHDSSPALIVSQINDAMADTNETMMFVTLFVGVLDLPTGRLRYCNAGHCAPLIINSDVEVLPIIANLPSGITTDFRFEAQETIITPGTTIFLYTDGLTEAENIEKELFGEDRMMEVARKVRSQKVEEINPQLLIQEMTDAVHAFVCEAEQSDDLTMLAVNYKNEEREYKFQRSITLPNNIETIPQLSEFVDEVCETAGYGMSETMSLNLAIEEAVVNVMNYAYPEGMTGDVTIEAKANDVTLKFVIIDSGKPFDPTAKGKVDTTLSAEDRPIGGLGIHLVREIMDSVNYEYNAGRNVLTLSKSLPTDNNNNETI